MVHKNQLTPEIIDIFVHEIKTPLATIKLLSELIKESSYGSKINQKTDEITNMINYFRDLSHLLSARSISQPKIISLDQLVDEYKFKAKTIKNFNISIDPNHFKQIIDILCDRIFYYQANTKLFLTADKKKDFIIFSISNDQLAPRSLPDNSTNLVNPNTSLFFVQSLINYYHGYYRFRKNHQGKIHLCFSLPLVQ